MEGCRRESFPIDPRYHYPSAMPSAPERPAPIPPSVVVRAAGAAAAVAAAAAAAAPPNIALLASRCLLLTNSADVASPDELKDWSRHAPRLVRAQELCPWVAMST